ncbi:MAG: hypothetical protein JXA00_02430 [Candidatus Thermoplasmatota archaeon]|nr:hypothetical protein [Candidatus Thermoplasmatota archaeon]
MLVLTLIPVAAGAAVEEKEPETTDIGVTYIRGIITKPQLVNGGHDITFRCIWVHYNTRGIGEKQSGFLHLFQKLTLKNDFIGVVGLGPMKHFIFARFPGQLEL